MCRTYFPSASGLAIHDTNSQYKLTPCGENCDGSQRTQTGSEELADASLNPHQLPLVERLTNGVSSTAKISKHRIY